MAREVLLIRPESPEKRMVTMDKLKAFSRWNGVLVAAGGGLVLLGWLLNNDLLKRIIPGFVAMNPITALGFIAAGVSLCCFWEPGRAMLLLKCGRILAVFLMVIGLVKLAAYFFHFDVPFDRVLFGNEIRGERTGFPNQIAPNTAFNFLIAGCALWFLHSPARRFSRWAQNLSLILVFISLVPLVGYIYRASYLYGIGSYIPMALHTALFFFFLGMALLLAQTGSGVVALFMSQTPGGAIARRLLPFAFTIPLILGALAIWGIKSETYPSELGVTIVVVGSAASFIALIWRDARLLNAADHERRQAGEQLQKAYDELEDRVRERTAKLNDANKTLSLRITELQIAQEKISEQAELLNKAQDAILVLNADHQVAFWNHGAERLYGWKAGEVMNRAVDKLLFNGLPLPPAGYKEVISHGTWAGELEQVTKSGQHLLVESRWTLVRDACGQPKGILVINTDVTEKKNYEKQLFRAQRMESIGALAGGVAHDLNNALTPVLIGTQLLETCNSNEDRKKLLEMISASAHRGTEMVKQILSFARGSRGKVGPLQLQHVIAEMSKIARDTFPKSILIQSSPTRDLWAVHGDMTELHQVLLNLCVNARDAMPEGGQLTLTAENIRLETGKSCAGSNIPPGSYVLLRVADTGLGIPKDVLPRIFEPFFSTKAPDKGTGLGLSTVASIVKHHQGFIEIQTEPGKGTEFKIYLPATESVELDQPSLQVELPPGNGELILIMDDEEAVRELSKTTLENFGYRVITAAHGAQGIARFKQHQHEIKVLVTDTDMPVMDGVSAVRAIQQLAPGIPIIFASGAKREFEKIAGINAACLSTLSKPYTVEQLLAAVANALKIPATKRVTERIAAE